MKLLIVNKLISHRTEKEVHEVEVDHYTPSGFVDWVRCSLVPLLWLNPIPQAGGIKQLNLPTL